MLQIKYEALQQSYEALRNDLKQKEKIILSLKEKNNKLQRMVEVCHETHCNQNDQDSLDSGSSKHTAHDKNLQIVHEAVTDDEYKFMEDLHREKQSPELAVSPRSNIIKKAHTDAEQEFFLLSLLSCKIDLATKGCSNAAVSDVSPQALWNTAQECDISMHQFHDWIMDKLLKTYQETQNEAKPISHTWNSSQSPHLHEHDRSVQSIVGDHDSSSTAQQRNVHKILNGVKYESPKQLLNEEQILTDEESDYDEEEEPQTRYSAQQREPINVI